MDGVVGVWILCGVLLLIAAFLGFFYVFRTRQVERWKTQSRGQLVTKPKGRTPSKFKGIRASFSQGALRLPPVKRLSTDFREDTPPALKEARRQMAQGMESEQNQINAIQVDISSVAYSKYKQLVYEENGFVNVDLNENEDSLGEESGCVLATSASGTPSTPRSDGSIDIDPAHGQQQQQPKWRKHSETEI